MKRALFKTAVGLLLGLGFGLIVFVIFYPLIRLDWPAYVNLPWMIGWLAVVLTMLFMADQ